MVWDAARSFECRCRSQSESDEALAFRLWAFGFRLSAEAQSLKPKAKSLESYCLYGFLAAARIWFITGIFSTGGCALLKLLM